ncbi:MULTISPECIES: hypothetical protein [Streptomyces]|uniref:hypothetical protein n=1 Tax=Streptomyces TaxID=1883 RepID=UPI00163BD7F8|nr:MULTISPECIES: hypothetical protein [Streptomyces]MBC2875735.1 hypothetical protein [Streptomyces sp. TYQ1024]UBI37588.1 hypothetical protein K7I03_14680 [Streptomyces mobaraensis]UKW30176.1 hypothetical protein MCU78_14645 [Streptomyces sp. TYQ1024]
MFSPYSWGVTEGERTAGYPCDRHLTKPYRSLHRAVGVRAPAPLTFRWLCQLKTNAYSYGRMRTSSRALTTGADELAVGQRFLVFHLVEFEVGSHITGITSPEARRMYGEMAVTYRVVPQGDQASRLVVRLNMADARGLARLRIPVLAAGDAVVMRKQLLTLKGLAERDAAAQ